MKDEEIDKLFADSLRDAKSEVPKELWMNIASDLDKQTAKDNIRFINWRIWTIAASCLLILSFGIWKMFFNLDNIQSEKTNTIAQIEKTKEVMESNKEIETKSSLKSSVEKPQPLSVVKVKKANNLGTKKIAPDYKAIEEKIVEIEEEPIKEDIQLAKLELEKNIEFENRIISANSNESYQELVDVQHGITVDPIEEESDVASPKSILVNVLNVISNNIKVGKDAIKFSHDNEGNIKFSLTSK